MIGGVAPARAGVEHLCLGHLPFPSFAARVLKSPHLALVLPGHGAPCWGQIKVPDPILRQSQPAAWGSACAAAWGAVFYQGRSGRTEVNRVQVHFLNICKLLSVTAKGELLGRKLQGFCCSSCTPVLLGLDGRNKGKEEV